MSEFTGERVVPGLVEDDLFNEHIARYRFADRIARQSGKALSILDAGCGTGYGSAAFTKAHSITAIDFSFDALQHAREHFARPHVRYAQARCEALPFRDGSFDLVCSFEVIEHLERWGDLLTEARRVLKPGGVLLVSTPNKAYYAEARASAGPNPFHAHEFEYEEFESALHGVFPHVRLWSQNHTAALAFAPLQPSSFELDADGNSKQQDAHFFLAACSSSPIAANTLYAWLPQSGNVLQERERHIAKLERELAQKDEWLLARAKEHSELQLAHEAVENELRQSNAWAAGLTARIAELDGRIVTLQQESAQRIVWIRDLETQIADGEAQIAGATAEIARLNQHRAQLETELERRAAWGFALDAEVADLSGRVANLTDERRLIAESKWFRLGRKLNLGPHLE